MEMKNIVKCGLKEMVEKVAYKKANSNCFGVMYEPKKPAKLLNKER